MEVKGIYKGNPEIVTFGEGKTMTKFRLTLDESSQYPQTIEFQFFGSKIDLSILAVNQEVEVHFNLKGKEYEKKDGSGKGCFNSLDAWKIIPLGQKPIEYGNQIQGGQQSLPPNHMVQAGEVNTPIENDDLPF